MIRATLENDVQIILNNGKWICADPELAEMLNISQEFWRSREKEDFSPGAPSKDNAAAAKVLAQFGGEVSFISADRYAAVAIDERVYC